MGQLIYFFTYFFTKFLSLLFFPRSVSGRENIPASGAFILASNHRSNLDPPTMGISVGRRVAYMAKDSLFFNPFVGWWLRKLWAFPVKREEGDVGAVRETFKRLKKGQPVLIFVEGTRQSANGQSKAQSGVGFLAVKSKVPVIPVYIEGTDNVMPPGSKGFKRAPVTIRFGVPVPIDPSKSYEDISQDVLKAIYSLA